MWEYLGVSDSYKKIFLDISNSLDGSTMLNYFQYEIENCKKFNDVLSVRILYKLYLFIFN